MALGIFFVESYPKSPDDVDAYNQWYDKVHLPEIVASEGFVSARRFRPLADGDPYIAIYEIEADDLSSVATGLAATRNQRSAPVGLRADPPSRVRWYEQITDYKP